MIILKAHKKMVDTVVFMPDGRALVSMGRDPAVKMWDLTNGKAVWEAQPTRPAWMVGMTVSPDGKWVASWEKHEGVQIRDAGSGKEVALLPVESHGLYGSAAIVAFRPDGRSLVMSSETARQRRTLRWWKTSDWSPLKQWESDPRNGDFFGAAFSADGKRLATIDFFSVRLWDVANGSVRWSSEVKVKYWVATVALAPNSQVLAFAAGADLQIVDVKSKAVVTNLKSSIKHVQQCAFSPDGRYLASVSNDKTVVFWDTTTWKEARRYSWNIGELKCLASSDGTLAAAGSAQGKIVIWDVD
jgi:WD40 repeat protein